MELNVLVDNNTLIDRYFLGEPGLSFFLKDEDTSILFDLGYSDVFMKNACKMGINLNCLDHLIISHGHLDHTWGIYYLIQKYTEAQIEKKPFKRPVITACDGVFDMKTNNFIPSTGSIFSPQTICRQFKTNISDEPYFLTKNLLFVGKVPRKFKFEQAISIDKKLVNDELVDDLLVEDTGLVYISDKGLIIISGCAHCGICNMIEHAKEITGRDKVSCVIGGFHLLNPNSERFDGVIKYLKSLELDCLYPSHCTDLMSKIEMFNAGLPLKEVGVGLKLNFNL